MHNFNLTMQKLCTPRINTLMEAEAVPKTFLVFISYVPVFKRVASLIRMAEESVVFSIDRCELVTNSFPSLSHSIVGSGLAIIPSFILIEAPALYCTTSRYSGGRSMTGAPKRGGRIICYIC